MLLSAQDSCLLIVDVQEKLVPAIHEPEQLVGGCAWLMQVANVLAVPILVSEQYPIGLGPTVAELRGLVSPEAFVEKVHFSCAAAPDCLRRLDAIARRQVVLAGIEAHVCVLQTALGLAQAGKQVFVVADAISSRNPQDATVGIARMRAVGVHVVTKEMALFEWAERAATTQFRLLSNNFLR